MGERGKPPKYKNSTELQKAIDNYFLHTQEQEEPLTITGLAFHLGFESRQSIYDYEKNGDYSYTIKRARLRIENFAEKKLFGIAPTGAIFALKNFGWRDKQEIDLHADIESDNTFHIVKKNADT